MKKIIIIGAGAAGAKAASKAKRLNPNNIIQLYSDESNIAYSRCGLPYFIEGIIDNIDKLIIKTPEKFVENGIEVYVNQKLEKIIPEKKCVIINKNHIFYDDLILALGARVNIPDIKNINAKNIFTLRTLQDGIDIKNAREKYKTVLIVGCGYTCIELIEAFCVNGLKVIVVDKNKRIFTNFDKEFSDILKNIIYKKCKENIDFYLNENISEFLIDENNQFLGAKTESGIEIKADFCVVVTGIIPNTEIAKQAGIQLGQNSAIYVDTKMRTNMQNIYACGDCTEEFDLVTRLSTYLAQGTIANKEGRITAINVSDVGYKEDFDGILRSTITKFYDYTISKTGLTYSEALEYSKIINIKPIEAIISKSEKASYMPDYHELTFKIVADSRSGEILGAQGIGHIGFIAQRINTITSFLKQRGKVDDLLHLDLPYSPPFSTSVDPILTIAYLLKEKMNN